MSGTQVYLLMAAIVFPLLMVDLRLGRRAGGLTLRQAAIWSVIWVMVGVAFGVLVLPRYTTTDPITTFLTVYALEKSLSIDNVFLWLLIFATFGVPREYQRRVLFYGILGAVVFRTTLIHASTTLLDRATWLLFIAAAVLLFGSWKLWRERATEPTSLENPLLERALRRIIPTTDGFRGDRFVVREHGALLATPLLFVLVFVELSDIVLALDALPAALSVTNDPVMITTANLFAVLGLRSLYSLLAEVAERLTFLKPAVAVILAWIAVTLVLEHVWGAYPLSTLHSLAVIVTVLLIATVRSLANQPTTVERGE